MITLVLDELVNAASDEVKGSRVLTGASASDHRPSLEKPIGAPLASSLPHVEGADATAFIPGLIAARLVLDDTGPESTSDEKPSEVISFLAGGPGIAIASPPPSAGKAVAIGGRLTLRYGERRLSDRACLERNGPPELGPEPDPRPGTAELSVSTERDLRALIWLSAMNHTVVRHQVQ